MGSSLYICWPNRWLGAHLYVSTFIYERMPMFVFWLLVGSCHPPQQLWFAAT